MTERELRQGSIAEMVARIANEHRNRDDRVDDVEAAPRSRRRRPRLTGRLFPNAPRR